MHHSHAHDHKYADKWTNIATAGEATASFISDAYWLATLFDIVSNAGPETLGLSFYGVGFGAIFAVLSASGAAYSHRTLNTHHQPKQSAKDSVAEYISIPGISIQTADSEGSEHKHAHLTLSQKLALVGDFISHAGDIAGPLTFVINLATNNNLSRMGKGLMQCGATLFGGIASIANVRTCREAMLAQNMLDDTSLKDYSRG